MAGIQAERFYRRIMDESYLPLKKLWYEQESSDRAIEILYQDSLIPRFTLSVIICEDTTEYQSAWQIWRNKQEKKRRSYGLL